MLDFVKTFNFVFFILFTAAYFYQFVYIFVALFFKDRSPVKADVRQHRYAFLLAARNEEAVIADLINSIRSQRYPQELIDVFVVADNCTDGTAEVARGTGAHVYERFNKEQVGKGYALNYLLDNINNEFGDTYFDGYFVFDADNLLHPDYVSEMNKIFDRGYRIITSYRNSRNFDTNWITSGYSIWFLREAKYLNNSRMKLGTSCAVSGTGFLVSSEVFRENGGWKHHLLTEDIEFSTDSILHEETIGYCGTAMFYDEQPVTFAQSWKQRLRWSKGFYQVIGKYGRKLVKGIFTNKNAFACYDMLITVFPAIFLTILGTFLNLIFMLSALFMPGETNTLLVNECALSIATSVLSFYMLMYAQGLLTVITEWKKINCVAWKKIAYGFTFPLFFMTYLPISIAALFKKVEWTSIKHGISTAAQSDAIAKQMEESLEK